MCGHDVHTEYHDGVSADGPIHVLVVGGHMRGEFTGEDAPITVAVYIGDAEADAICRRLAAQRMAGMVPVLSSPRPMSLVRWIGNRFHRSDKKVTK